MGFFTPLAEIAVLRLEDAALALVEAATTQYRFYAPCSGTYTVIGVEVTVTFCCGTQCNYVLTDVDTVHHELRAMAHHHDSEPVILDLNDIVDVREAESQQIALGLLI